MRIYSYSRLKIAYFVLFSLLSRVTFSQNEIAHSVVSLPIVLYNQDQTSETSNFEYDFMHPHMRLEFSVTNFCEKHNIQGTSCRQFYSAAQQRINEVKSEYYRSIKINPDLPVSAEIPDSQQYGMIRVSRAVQALIDFDQPGKRQELMNRYHDGLNVAREVIISRLNAVSIQREIKRIVFIHSTLLSNSQSPQILQSMLNSLKQSDLYQITSLAIVCHYGIPLSVPYIESFPEVLFLHIANETSLFELPTLNLMHTIFNIPSSVPASTQVLYLQTMGQSYQLAYPQIDNWRNMLLHFLSDNHQSCYHLLESTLFDVVGVNFINNPNRLAGNFWWSTAKHIASLPPLNHLHVQRVDMEAWIISKPRTRLYMFYSTNINHHEVTYPWYCFRSANTENEQPMLPLLDEWREVCNDQDDVRYQQLHHKDGVNFGQVKSSSLCVALEL